MLPMKLKVLADKEAPITVATNPLLMETYEEEKARLFNLHKSNLDKLMTKSPEKFLGYKVVQRDGRLITINRGLQKVYSLFNQELVNYRSDDELTRFLDIELKKF